MIRKIIQREVDGNEFNENNNIEKKDALGIEFQEGNTFGFKHEKDIESGQKACKQNQEFEKHKKVSHYNVLITPIDKGMGLSVMEFRSEGKTGNSGYRKYFLFVFEKEEPLIP
jgi:hypothetical protein